MPYRHPRPARLAALALAGVLATGAAPAAEPVTPELTPKLDRLLREEMQAIQEAMQEAYAALVTGDHATVAEQAQAIHDSFILKRELTATDRRDLKGAVPKRFLKMDQRFHRQAAKLAEAARAEDTAREMTLFRQMSQACIRCHSTYVHDRFPGLEDTRP
jgi:cytochrome c556